jgi:hypothetical protein
MASTFCCFSGKPRILGIADRDSQVRLQLPVEFFFAPAAFARQQQL